MLTIEWRVWSNNTLIEKTPELLNMIETNIEIFPAENQEKNKALIERFRSHPLTTADLDSDIRNKDLLIIGYLVQAVAHHQGQSNSVESKVELLQAAHELFRAANPTSRPTKAMHQVVLDTVRSMIDVGIERIKIGEGDASILHEKLENFVESAWGTIPSQDSLTINELLLRELEQVRVSIEQDIALHRNFVRTNVEAVLTMEVPTRLQQTVEKWADIGEHVAPATVRDAKRNFSRPRKLSELMPKATVDELEQAVERGDVELLRQALTEIEELLESNLRLRLNARTEYREPVSEMRFQGGADRFFQEARELLVRRDVRALEKFKNIHFHKPGHTTANEWYAFALTVFGRSTDIHEIIELLEEAIRSEHYHKEYGWVARWNLACALSRLPGRFKEALEILLPILDIDYHVSDVFELCLLWALEQDREDILDNLLLKSPHYEAHLLIALYSARKPSEERFHTHFRRLNKILKDVDHTFPDPAERLNEKEIDQLTQDFIENSLLDAGIEWFGQRLSSEQERYFYKNWECAARLNEAVGNMDATWRCKERQWYSTQNNKKLNNIQKGRLLSQTLSWAERNGHKDSALRILLQGWRKTNFTNADLQLWQQRLQQTTVSNSNKNNYSPSTHKAKISEPAPETDLESSHGDQLISAADMSISEAETIFQETAGAFKGIANADALAVKFPEAEKLLNAAIAKHHDIPIIITDTIKEVLRLATIFHRGLDEEESRDLVVDLRNQVDILRENRPSIPFELMGLVEACERVAQSLAVKLKAVSDPNITPPVDLKIVLDQPDDERYLTRICTRVLNPALEDMSNISVAFTSPSQYIKILSDSVTLPRLSSQGRYIFECPIEVNPGVKDDVEINIFINYQIGNVKRSIKRNSILPIGSFGEPIPLGERFNTTRPVAAERKDLFQGRKKELKDLKDAFTGGQLRKLYFVNGIRRVGKSSLLLHLASEMRQALPFIMNVEELLAGQKMPSVHFVRQLMRACIEEINKIDDLPPSEIALPSPSLFELDPPWVVFDDFMNEIRQKTQRKTILLCFDEVQRLVMRIADKDDPMDEGFLSWLRGKSERGSSTLIVCTGSEPYDIMRRRHEHNLWANMEPYNVSFVDEDAMKKVVTLPLAGDGVIWLPESLERLWDFTEGHPWVIQMIAEKICDSLNQDRRRVVMPCDVDTAVDIILTSDERPANLWWNESNGLISPNHRQVAFLILQHQKESRAGILEAELGIICQRAGLRSVGKLLDEMRVLEVLTGKLEGSDTRWRIRGAFLEKHLAVLAQRDKQERGAVQPIKGDLPLALMLDWENVKINLSKLLKQMPTEKQRDLAARLEVPDLASRLHELAERHGVARQRWAVANWDNGFFRGDQADFRKQVRYETDMSGQSKADASDHVLRERIHEVLRDHPEIATFIIATGDADFAEAIRTLQIQGKRVVLWSTRNSINNEAYKFMLAGPDAITVEWLEDMVFQAEE